MNPFNVKRFATIFLNSEYLNIENKSEFLNKVLETMNKKYEFVNVMITNQRPSNLENVKEVFIHNSPAIDEAIGLDLNDLGAASYEAGQAEVNVEDVFNSIGEVNLDHLAETVGTVASHESAHLLLPRGHSSEESINLMTDGSIITPFLQEQDNMLKFTESQIELMNSGIENPASQYIYQNTQLSGYEEYISSLNELSQMPVEAWVPDETLWGSMNVNIFNQTEGLPDIAEADYLQSFDINSIDQIDINSLADVPTDILDNIGDLFESLDLGDLLEGLGGLFL